MKTWNVIIYRRISAFDNFSFSKTVEIKARTERSAWNKAEKMYNNPYQMVWGIELKNN